MATNSALNQVAVILGKGDGSFDAPSYYTVGAAPWNIVVGDINQDGFLDLAVASDASGSVSILQGNGDGTFQSLYYRSHRRYQVGSVAIGDFNGDGWPDLATTSAPDNAVYILLNEKTATHPSRSAVQYTMNGGPYYLTIGDFNRDGHLDIISANNGNNTVGVLLNNGDGTFGGATYYPVGAGSIFANAADINGDDRVDLTAVTGNGLSVLLSGEQATASNSNVAVNGCKTHIRNRYLRRRHELCGGALPSVNFNSMPQPYHPDSHPHARKGRRWGSSRLSATLSPYNYGTDYDQWRSRSPSTNGGTVFGTAPLSSGVAVLNILLLRHSRTVPGDLCWRLRFEQQHQQHNQRYDLAIVDPNLGEPRAHHVRYSAERHSIECDR